jgi:beta-1,4-mannosyltransferase
MMTIQTGRSTMSDDTETPTGSAHRTDNGIRVRILLSPFSNAANRYVDMLRELLVELDYDVQPLTLRTLLRGRFAQLFDPNTVLVFHWIELRAFRAKRGRVLPVFGGMLVFAFYCMLMCIGRAKVVYFVHDHAVHDAVGWVRWLSMRMMSIVRRLAGFRVVHAPGFERQYRARYLPHPLYWDAPDGAPPAPRGETAAVPRFALLGTIRPYKQIAEVLSVWPQDCNLHIAGSGSTAYLDTLREIVRTRSLASVTSIDARFLSDDEFDQKLDAADVLILPHASDSMLVSGAFFEAIGRVPVLIARSTPFIAWAAQKFDNVLLFDDIAQLPELVHSVASAWPVTAQQDVERLALDEFGWQTCRRQYGQFFAQVVGSVAGAFDGAVGGSVGGSVGSSVGSAIAADRANDTQPDARPATARAVIPMPAKGSQEPQA